MVPSSIDKKNSLHFPHQVDRGLSLQWTYEDLMAPSSSHCLYYLALLLMIIIDI